MTTETKAPDTFRLTTTVRETLQERLIDHRFKERGRKLHERVARLAQACYARQYRSKVEPGTTKLDLIASLPSGWLPEEDSLRVQFAGTRFVELHFDGRFPGDYGGGLKTEEPKRRFPQEDANQCRLAVDAAHKLSETWDELSADIKLYREEKKLLEKEVEGVLGSVTTTGALVKAWPEVATFIKDLAPVARPALPAPLIRSLNERLGIKPRKAA